MVSTKHGLSMKMYVDRTNQSCHLLQYSRKPLAMDKNMSGTHNVQYLIPFLFRGEVSAASAEFHGKTLPGVWWLGWEQTQLHSNLQWIRESLGSLLLYHETPTSALKPFWKTWFSITMSPPVWSVYIGGISGLIFFCRLVCWKNTWSSSWCRGSLDLTWTRS